MDANAGQDFRDLRFVVAKMRHHSEPGLHLVDQVPGSVVRRVGLVDGDVGHHGGHSELERAEVSQVRLRFGDEHIHALGQLRGQLIRPAVAGPDERKSVPVEPIRAGAVLGVRTPPVADRHPILVVADAVVVAEIEFVDFDFVAVADRECVETIRVPMRHLPHVIDHVPDAVLRRSA